MSVKSTIETILRHHPPLYRLGSQFYHRINGSFRTLSPGAPEAIFKAFERVQNEACASVGDYYEFGLFRGYTFLEAYRHCQSLGIDETRFYGFDSFEGLPAAEGIDQTDGRFYQGQFSCSLEEVQGNLLRHGLDQSRATLVKGYYEDSLTQTLYREHAFRSAAVIMFDCDYYASTRNALEWVHPFITSGTVLLFDDWFAFGDEPALGQQKALADFLANHQQFAVERLWDFEKHGRSFIVRSRG